MPRSRARWAIIPCSKEKRWDGGHWRGPCRALDAYTSPLFCAAVAWGRRHAERIVILSALHGLVDEDGLIAGPYDVTFARSEDPVVDGGTLARQARALGLWPLPHGGVVVALPGDYAARLSAAVAPELVAANLLAGVFHHDLQAMRRRILAATAAPGDG